MNIKQVIVWRNDLRVRKGKMAAQCSHASMIPILKEMKKETFDDGSVRTLELKKKDPMEHWLSNSFAKIVLKCSSEEELLNLYKQAEDAGLPCGLVIDAGRTEFKGVPTRTCIAIGPAKSEDIDKITGKLGLM